MVLIRSLCALILGAVVLSGCGGSNEKTSSPDASGRAEVVAAFYPLAEVARQVGRSHVRVRDLTPPGAEPHDLELRPSQVEAVRDADLVLVMGADFQPSVERAARRRPGGRGIVEILPAVLGGEGEKKDVDPHIWLDPPTMASIVDTVRARLRAAVPAEAGPELEANAAAYREKVAALDGRYRVGLAQCARREIVTSHEAFGRLATRYGLAQESIAGISPEAEPSPARMSELADYVRAHGVTTIFTEQLLSPRVAQALAREAGVRTDALSPIEGLTPDEIKAGENYVTVMDDNLGKLRAALACT